MKLICVFLNLVIASQLCATSAPPPMPKLLIKKEMTKEEEKKRAAQASQLMPAMPEQPTISAAPEVKAQIIPVQVSPLIRGKPESINLEDTEPLTAETYGELLERQKEHNKQMILARVVTYNPADNKSFVHYFDAYSFNVWRFGRNYSLSGSLNIVHIDDPLNNEPIIEVQYFIYNPKEPVNGFQYAFSESDFIKNPQIRLVVDENQNIDASRKKEAYEHVSGERVPESIPYRQEPGPRFHGEPQPQRAVQPRPQTLPNEDFEIAALHGLIDATEDPFVRANLQTQLAGIYYRHEDYARAREYYELAENQTVNPDARAIAQGWLGEIYLFGQGVPQHMRKAIGYFKNAANQIVDPKAKAESEWRLGEINYNGYIDTHQEPSIRVAPDYVVARRYFEKALHQLASPQARANAQIYLGFMYYNGYAVLRDKGLAHEYLDAALKSGWVRRGYAQREATKVLASINRQMHEQQDETTLKRAIAESKTLAEQKEKEQRSRRGVLLPQPSQPPPEIESDEEDGYLRQRGQNTCCSLQ